MKVLSHLNPKNVFKYFEEICGIPHGSGNTSAISEYCCEFAKKHGLFYIKDELNNVIIKKPAFKGYEEHPSIILQGHLDMVLEKEPDIEFDFSKDPISLKIEDDFIYANGTTLGGDDGIAVAMILAILEDKNLPAPMIEALFTVDEETGMFGADGLDASFLSSKRLINIDMEEEGFLTVGCAGGARADITIPLDKTNIECDFYEIVLDGLRGGHSGVEIDKGRLNANKILAKFLNSFDFEYLIADIEGGLKDNAIPRLSKAVIASKTNPDCYIKSFLKENTPPTDKGLKITVSKIKSLNQAFSKDSTQKIVSFLNNVKNGIISFSQNVKGLVETSLNLGVLKVENNNLFATFAVRSSKNAAKTALLEELKTTALKFNGTINTHSFYPAWEYRENSFLRDKMSQVYFDLYNKKPQIMLIHAGLECGILGEKIKDLDAVSFGPDIFDVHTTQEHLSISSVERSYHYLCEVLKNL